ncbi:MAG: hypothetical protein IT355_11475 [Gemmatimonadaceae bacterium]|nr:hypothetical protein [Gemmatimonadaceae bacterium]
MRSSAIRLALSLTGRAVALVALVAGSLASQGRPVTGTYTTSIESPQGAVKTVIVVKRTGEALGGTVAADGFPVIPITTVTQSDSGMTILADTPDGGVSVKLKFTGADRVAGTLAYQGMEMPLAGTFAAEGAPAGAALATAAGTYDFVTTGPLLGAAQFDVKCLITRSASGTYGGTCGNPESGDVAVGSVTQAGNQVTMTGDTPAGPFRIELTVNGTVLEGTITVGGESSKLKGTYAANGGAAR